MGKKERTFALNTAQRTKSTCHASTSHQGRLFGLGRLCNFLATIFFYFSPVFYLLPALLFFVDKGRARKLLQLPPRGTKEQLKRNGGERE